MERVEEKLFKKNVLYYPYINLPKTDWLTRMLLYYEKVGTITPQEYKTHPNKFEPFTLDLIREGLVTQIFPYEYVHSVKGFAESFEQYTDSLGPELEKRCRSFHSRSTLFVPKKVKVHISKMDTVCDYLVDKGLAKKHSYKWYWVESATALDLMSYLAAIIGQVDEAGFTPITHETMPLNRLLDMRVENKISQLRMEVLTHVFPAPRQPLTPIDIFRFKEKHGDKLNDFRFFIEKSLIEILNIQDDDLKARRIALFKQESSDNIDELKARMIEFGWLKIGLANFYGILEPIMSPVLGVLRAVFKALTDSYSSVPNNIKETPLLYAAVAQKELFKV